MDLLRRFDAPIDTEHLAYNSCRYAVVNIAITFTCGVIRVLLEVYTDTCWVPTSCSQDAMLWVVGSQDAMLGLLAARMQCYG